MTLEAGAAPSPGAPVFEAWFRVRFHEADPLGHVNNSAYINYLEQAAIDHAVSLGLDKAHLWALGGVFVARRHEVDFLKPAFAGDLLRVVTWLGEPRGARVLRHYRVFRDPGARAVPWLTGRQVRAEQDVLTGELVVRANTEWVFANEQGRPRKIPDDVIRVFQSDLANVVTDTPSD